MNQLQRRALARLPFKVATVEAFYNDVYGGETARRCLKALCESHERLRMELEGAELLLGGERERCAAILEQSALLFPDEPQIRAILRANAESIRE